MRKLQTIKEWLQNQDKEVLRFVESVKEGSRKDHTILGRVNTFTTGNMSDLEQGYTKYIYLREAKAFHCNDYGENDDGKGLCCTITVHQNWPKEGVSSFDRDETYVRLNSEEFDDLAQLMGYRRVN